MKVVVKSWKKDKDNSVFKVEVKSSLGGTYKEFSVIGSEDSWKPKFTEWFNDYYKPQNKLTVKNFSNLGPSYGIDIFNVSVKRKKDLGKLDTK